MDKSRLKVIKGNKIQGIEKKYNFIEAYVTNTRLMGVVGLRITWQLDSSEIYNQFFHLDAEEFGLDDYTSITNGSNDDIEAITSKVMGGLGGELVPVSEKEARYLIKSFVAKNKQWRQPMPEPEWEYYFIIKEDVALSQNEIDTLWNKVTEEIQYPNQLINYFIMRAIGMDAESIARLTNNKELEYSPVTKPATLLKNIIEVADNEGETSYITESVVDMGESYKMIVSEIHISNDNGLKVTNAEIKSVMNITSTEASFALGKKEYLIIFQIEDIWELLRIMESDKPQCMKNAYEVGYLFTEFNSTNDHVNQTVYYLNEDIYGVYYVTAAEQMVVAAYSKDRIEEIKEHFTAGSFKKILSLEKELDLDNLMLYEFVHSDYDDIYDFLESE